MSPVEALGAESAVQRSGTRTRAPERIYRETIVRRVDVVESRRDPLQLVRSVSLVRCSPDDAQEAAHIKVQSSCLCIHPHPVELPITVPLASGQNKATAGAMPTSTELI